MAEVDLAPEELDRLEDALEELELDGALERWSEDDVGPRVHARLVDFRSILAVSRQALPLEEVPSGVLDGVLAQAQQAAMVGASAAAVGPEPWWARLRRSFMVPVLALAGTAALVLWVFDPDEAAKVAEPPAPAARPAPAGGARAEEERAAYSAPAATPVEAAAAEPPPADAGPAEGEAVEAKRDMAKQEIDAKPTETATATGSEGSRGMSPLGDAPGGDAGAAKGAPAQPATKNAGPASGRWDIVSRGDRARLRGDCVAARDEYALALEDDEPRVRARAYAGLGLCDAAAGDEASADANFERARGLDDAIGGFIESQGERSAGKKSRKPTKKSKAAVDAYDPFG